MAPESGLRQPARPPQGSLIMGGQPKLLGSAARLSRLATTLAFAIVLSLATLFACFTAALAFAAIQAFAVVFAGGGVRGGTGARFGIGIGIATRNAKGACDQSRHRGRHD